MKNATTQLLRGTLHVLILKILTSGPQHGYSIATAIEERTEGAFRIDDGALYQALHRMQERGWVESEWGHSERGKRARFYNLTDEGKQRLRVETATWLKYSEAVVKVLQPYGA